MIDCNSACTLNDVDYEFVDSLENMDFERETPCYGYDEKDCKYNFVYYHKSTNNKLSVRIKMVRECPEHFNPLGIALGVIAAVVLIGLAFLLLWKLLTTIHDRREFARFEKERMMAKWDAVSILFPFADINMK